MKHKNILLVVFFLTLFVVQQAQAGGERVKNKSYSHLAGDCNFFV